MCYLLFYSFQKEASYFVTLNSDLEPLKRALNQTTVIPWQGNLTFQIIQSRFTDSLVEAFTSKYVNCEISSNTMFWYPPSKTVENQ